jgi:hypothetical protein
MRKGVEYNPIDLIEAVRTLPPEHVPSHTQPTWSLYRRAIRAAALMQATPEDVEHVAACLGPLGLRLEDAAEHVRIMRRAYLLRVRLDDVECYTRRSGLQHQLAELFTLHPELFPNGLED